MDQYSSVFTDDPDWEISLRIRGPTCVVAPQKTNTTRVRPNQEGTTLSYVLQKLKIKLDNPDAWEIEALRHRSPEERARKNLCGTVKDVLMHYRKKVSGRFCFYLVRRRPTFHDRRFVEVDYNRARNYSRSVHSPVGPRPSSSLQFGQGHAPSSGLNNGSGLNTMSQQPRTVSVGWAGNQPANLPTERRQTPLSGLLMQHHQEENQQEVVGGIPDGGAFQRNNISLGSNHVVQNKCPLPKNLRVRLAESKVNRGSVQHASGARTSSGANTSVIGHGSARVNGNRINASPLDKPAQQHYITGILINPQNPHHNPGDIAKKLKAALNLN